MSNRKPFGLLLAGILCAHFALLLHCSLRESATFDEPAHVAAGAAYLRHGAMGIYNLSPPLLRMWDTLPMLLASPSVPDPVPFRRLSDDERHWTYLEAFQAQNLSKMDLYVLWGRFMQIPLSLALAAAIALTARRMYGDTASLVACAAYAFSPTVLANAVTIGTDLGVALAMFLAVMLFSRVLAVPGAQFRAGRFEIGFLLAVAVAHAIKFSALLLWPILIVMGAIEIAARRSNPKRIIKALICAGIVTILIIDISYLGQRIGEPVKQAYQSHFMQAFGRWLPTFLLPRDCVSGFDAQKFEAQGVYAANLFDEGYFGGDWRYYPWLVLTRTTIGGLILLATCLGSFAIRRPTRDEWPMILLVLGLAIGMTAAARINVGIRYLLPAYAPMAVLFARLVTFPRLRVVAIGAVALVAIESIASTPRYHSFVNLAAQSRRWQVPDQDVGQSLIELRDWMQATNQDEIALLNAGVIDPAAYGVAASDPLQPVQTPYVAIGRSFLTGLPTRSRIGFVFVRPWRRLRAIQPVADFGGTLVYRREDVVDPSGKPWVIPVTDWGSLLVEPELLHLRNTPDSN